MENETHKTERDFDYYGCYFVMIIICIVMFFLLKGFFGVLYQPRAKNLLRNAVQNHCNSCEDIVFHGSVPKVFRWYRKSSLQKELVFDSEKINYLLVTEDMPLTNIYLQHSVAGKDIIMTPEEALVNISKMLHSSKTTEEGIALRSTYNILIYQTCDEYGMIYCRYTFPQGWDCHFLPEEDGILFNAGSKIIIKNTP